MKPMTRPAGGDRRCRPVAVTAIALVVGGALLPARAARADGAFPDSLGIIAPADRPHDIVLATNFGVVTSIDDGQTWTWSCEQDRSSFGTQYQMSAPPLDRIYTRSQGSLAFSDDRACGWDIAGGAVAGTAITDAFPDPTDPGRMLAVAMATDADGGVGYRIYESSDGGATFATVRYTAASGDIVTGVEIARAAPATIYLTLISGAASTPKLGKSADGGATWQLRDLTAALGAGVRSVRLVAIDPENAARVYLRVADAGGERLAITDDGGVTAASPLMLPGGVMTAFVRTPSGAMLVTGKIGLGPVMYRSTDGAATFATLPVPPTLLGMTARGNLIYGASDTLVETEGAFVSEDQGTSWQPLLSFDAIQAIAPCVKTLCQDDCQLRAGLGQWSSDMCDAVPAPRATDGGAPTGDAGADAASPITDGGAGNQDAGAANHPADAGAGPANGAGCHCDSAGRAAPSPSPSPTPTAAPLATAVLLLAIRRRSRAVREPSLGRGRATGRPGGRLALDDLGDGLDEIVGLDRFRQVHVEAGLDRAHLVLRSGVGGERDRR